MKSMSVAEAKKLIEEAYSEHVGFEVVLTKEQVDGLDVGVMYGHITPQQAAEYILEACVLIQK